MNDKVSEAKKETPSVTRSTVPAGISDYGQFKPYLQKDFLYSCAYCTITESEARSIRFTIDHYESVDSRPDLKNQYDNLMYCCDSCNVRKGPRVPDPKMRSAGYRYFRPDQDERSVHFRLENRRLKYQTPTGDYSIIALSLNRDHLMRLRDLRARLFDCQAYIAAGVEALLDFRTDSLPSAIRISAQETIDNLNVLSKEFQSETKHILANFARSPLGDVIETEDDKKAKYKYLKEIKRKAAKSSFR